MTRMLEFQDRDVVVAPSVPPVTRDCLDCGARDGMTLQNAARTPPTNIPLLYVCEVCGAQLTIPPPPLKFPDSST